MPGPVSDAYDPEWGTAANGDVIREELARLHTHLSAMLNNPAPLFILDLLGQEMPDPVVIAMTTRDWRVIRFALERAGESI